MQKEKKEEGIQKALSEKSRDRVDDGGKGANVKKSQPKIQNTFSCCVIPLSNSALSCTRIVGTYIKMFVIIFAGQTTWGERFGPWHPILLKRLLERHKCPQHFHPNTPNQQDLVTRKPFQIGKILIQYTGINVVSILVH